jgi:hypothetical protein
MCSHDMSLRRDPKGLVETAESHRYAWWLSILAAFALTGTRHYNDAVMISNTERRALDDPDRISFAATPITPITPIARSLALTPLACAVRSAGTNTSDRTRTSSRCGRTLSAKWSAPRILIPPDSQKAR